MIRISKKTRLAGSDIINRAVAYFGESGMGLEEKHRSPCSIFFEGGGGYVRLNLAEEDKNRVVDLETREWEYPTRLFLKKL